MITEIAFQKMILTGPIKVITLLSDGLFCLKNHMLAGEEWGELQLIISYSWVYCSVNWLQPVRLTYDVNYLLIFHQIGMCILGGCDLYFGITYSPENMGTIKCHLQGNYSCLNNDFCKTIQYWGIWWLIQKLFKFVLRD